MMRARQLIAPLVALAAPTSAAPRRTWTWGVRDFEYLPDYVRVDPGDTVTWEVRPGQSHTITTRRGQPAPFDSGV